MVRRVSFEGLKSMEKLIARNAGVASERRSDMRDGYEREREITTPCP